MVNFDNSSVRRGDRLLGEREALDLLAGGEYGFLALGGVDGGYGVPLNYAWHGGAIYFHCAPEGEKLRRIAGCDRATFCVVGATRPVPGMFTTAYESVMVAGRIGVVADDGERMEALRCLIDKYSPGFAATGMKYAEKSFARTAILRLDIESVSGKAKRIAAEGELK